MPRGRPRKYDAQILAAWEEGLTVAQIAKRAHITAHTVRRSLRRGGLYPAARRRAWTDTDDAFLRSEYSRLGAAACGDALGRTEESVRNRVSRLGIAGTRGLSPDETRRRDALVAMGLSRNMLSTAIGVGYYGLSAILGSYRQPPRDTLGDGAVEYLAGALDALGMRLSNRLRLRGGAAQRACRLLHRELPESGIVEITDRSHLAAIASLMRCYSAYPEHWRSSSRQHPKPRPQGTSRIQDQGRESGQITHRT